MKPVNKIVVLLTLLGFIFSACEKDIASYSNDPGVYFFERNTDLTQSRITFKSFSFLQLPLDITKDTFYIKVKIMGETTAYDRIVRGQTIADSTTAIEGRHYDFIDGIVPAGAIIGYLPVVLYRTPDIADTTVTLNLSIAETKDFKTAISEDNFFTLSWSDNVVKPSNWDGFISLSAYFGTYSIAKYRFIISVTGIEQFPLQQSGRVPPEPGEFTAMAMMDISVRLKAALLEYNNTHTPALTDESGQLVTFP
jgi:hypothetical protein